MDDEARRLYLHNLLVSTFSDCTIYYRPSGNLAISRPCVIYEPKSAEPSYSNNALYVVGTRFQVTILSNLPGYSNRSDMLSLPGVIVVSNTSYVNADIVHDVFIVMVNSIR